MNGPRDRTDSREPMRRAEEALSRDDLAGALSALQEATRLDPFDDDPPLLAAALQLRAGDPIRAARLAVDALRVRPFHPSAIDVLAVACIEALQPDLARKLLARATRMAPGMDNLRRNLEDAKRKRRGLEGADVPREEVLRAAQLLPQAAIRELLVERAPELGAAIVVHAEQEERLPACIASLRGLASSVVVLDARPQGATPLRTDDAGVAVHRVPCEGPGAEALNAAWRRVAADWVLALEAGERLTPGAGETLRAAIRDPDALAWSVVLRPQDGPARRAVRLARNAPGIEFRGHVEPGLAASLAPLEQRWGLAIKDSDAELLREGRAASILEDPDRRARLRERIEQDLRRDDRDRVARLDMAALRLAEGAPAEALHLVGPLRQELAAEPHHSRPLDLEEPTIVEARCLVHLRAIDRLAGLIDDYHATCPPTASTRFLEGLCAKERRRSARAIESLLAVAREAAPGFAEPLPEIAGPQLPNLLGALLMEQGRLDEAREQFELARRRDPRNVEARLGLVGLEAARGETRAVLEELDRLIDSHGEDERVWVTGGILLGSRADLAPVAVDWYAEAARRLPQSLEVRRRLGEARLRCGRADEALDAWRDLDGADAPLAARVAAALGTDRDLPPIPAGRAHVLCGEVLRWFQRWAEQGALETLDRALCRLPRLEGRLAGLAGATAEWLERADQPEAAAKLRAEVTAG